MNFDTMDSSFDEENRISPYLMISANFEFSNRIQVEFQDGKDYAGDKLYRIELWRSRVVAISERGHEFKIAFEISDAAFAKLREYLKVLLLADCFRECMKKPNNTRNIKQNINANSRHNVRPR